MNGANNDNIDSDLATDDGPQPVRHECHDLAGKHISQPRTHDAIKSFPTQPNPLAPSQLGATDGKTGTNNVRNRVTAAHSHRLDDHVTRTHADNGATRLQAERIAHQKPFTLDERAIVWAQQNRNHLSSAFRLDPGFEVPEHLEPGDWEWDLWYTIDLMVKAAPDPDEPFVLLPLHDPFVETAGSRPKGRGPPGFVATMPLQGRPPPPKFADWLAFECESLKNTLDEYYDTSSVPDTGPRST